MQETLVLSASQIPISIVPWQRAFSLVFEKRAIVRESYDRLLHASNGTAYAMPSVIQCVKSVYTPKHFTKELPFSRKNVYIRDGGCCMYCGHKVSLSEFTFDHVVSKHDGGTVCWENIVVSCTRWNSEKGSKSVSNYKRKLIRKPYVPRLDRAAPTHIVSKLAAEIPHETWIDYIYWNVLLE